MESLFNNTNGNPLNDEETVLSNKIACVQHNWMRIELAFGALKDGSLQIHGEALRGCARRSRHIWCDTWLVPRPRPSRGSGSSRHRTASRDTRALASLDAHDLEHRRVAPCADMSRAMVVFLTAGLVACCDLITQPNLLVYVCTTLVVMILFSILPKNKIVKVPNTKCENFDVTGSRRLGDSQPQESVAEVGADLQTWRLQSLSRTPSSP